MRNVSHTTFATANSHVNLERIALSFVQLGNDSDDLTHDIIEKDAAFEKLRPLVDAERILNTSNSVESTKNELEKMHADVQKMQYVLSDLESPMNQISAQLELIQDGLDSKRPFSLQ